MAHAAEELDVVALEAHARAPAEAEPAPGQLDRDVVDQDREPGGEALDDHGERGAVGLTGGQVAQHSYTIGRADRERAPGSGASAYRRVPRVPGAIGPPVGSGESALQASRRAWPKRIAVIVPAARYGPEGDVVLAGLEAQGDERHPDHGAVEEAEEQPEEDVAPPEPARGTGRG